MSLPDEPEFDALADDYMKGMDEEEYGEWAESWRNHVAGPDPDEDYGFDIEPEEGADDDDGYFG